MEISQKVPEQVYFYKLRGEDSSWDYRGEPTKTYTQGFHSYPAMMIPQVAHRLIEEYSKEGDVLLDPFCGSGSVLVEAKITRRYSWGVDLNPLAVLIARVKTTPINPSILYKEFYGLINEIRKMRDDEAPSPQFFNLDFWFKEPVIRSLAKIKTAIDKIKATEVREFFQVTFSEVVRLSSNSRSGEFKLYRYPESKLKNHNPDPLRLFMEKAMINIEGMENFYRSCPIDVWSRVIEADSTKPVEAISRGSVDTIATSPPYGDSRTTVAYGQFSRLSSQWLGLMPEKALDLDSKMLGGRIHTKNDVGLTSPTLNIMMGYIFEKDVVRAKQIQSFYVDLCQGLKNMADYLRVGGYACIVIGNRRVKGMQLSTDIITCEIAQDCALVPQRIIIRNIPNKTMPLRNSPTNVRGVLEETMHKEYIVILKKS